MLFRVSIVILIILIFCPYHCQEYLFWRPELWCFRFLRLMPSLVKTIAAVKLWRSGKCLTRRSSSSSRRRMNLKFFNRLNFAIAFEHSSHLYGIYWWCIAKNILSKSRGTQGLSASRDVHSLDCFHLLSTAFTAFASYQHNIDVGSFRYNIGDIIILSQSHVNVFKEIVSQ